MLKPLHTLHSHFLSRWIAGTALILFVCSSARHLRLKSAAYDLGIYNQAIWLISQGQAPVSSFLRIHILGDHVSWIFYWIALLYKIYPSVYWLFAIQASSLALGALPTWLLARQADLSRSLAAAIAVAYTLYPVVFNLNLFDFHPEVIALPLFLGTVWAARANRKVGFCLMLVVILGCKAPLSLTVAAMGIWLLVFEKRYFFGIVALSAGTGWFLLATQWIIPFFKGGEVFGIKRYTYLGDSVLDIIHNIFLSPQLILGKVFSLDTLRYLALLVVPLVWGLSPQHLTPLVSAIPVLAMNILSTAEGQRTLGGQYSLAILPFLMVAVIATLASGKGWLRERRWIVLWVLVAFLCLTKVKYTQFMFYAENLDVWQANRSAIAQIQTKGGVLTTTFLAAQLSQRPFVYVVRPTNRPDPVRKISKKKLTRVDYALFDLNLSPQRQTNLQKMMSQIEQNPQFQLSYKQNKVFLFTRKDIAQSTLSDLPSGVSDQ